MPPFAAPALEMARLGPLMALTSGSADVRVGLVDGPVARDHPDLAGARIHPLAGDASSCSGGAACVHGTFVAGILAARRGGPAPAISPGCTLLVRPVFREGADAGAIATATADEVAQAIVDCVDAGARIVNLSAATGEPTTRVEGRIRQALDHAAGHGTVVVAAAGNQATLGSSEITRHGAAIPVVGYDRFGRPLDQSNFGSSAGRRGLGAPADAIVSLGVDGPPVTRAGTSLAAAFVTGAIALLWSLFPDARATQLRQALGRGSRRTSVIPPLLNAQSAYEHLAGQLQGMEPARL